MQFCSHLVAKRDSSACWPFHKYFFNVCIVLICIYRYCRYCTDTYMYSNFVKKISICSIKSFLWVQLSIYTYWFYIYFNNLHCWSLFKNFLKRWIFRPQNFWKTWKNILKLLEMFRKHFYNLQIKINTVNRGYFGHFWTLKLVF